MFESASFSDLPAFGVAHAEDALAGTGCTVFAAPDGAVCGVDVRGGGPATRETDLLDPTKMIERVHAVVLAGGSAFGLEAACGVMDVLADFGIGYLAAGAVVPIVPSACLFDLLVGKNTHPDKAMGAKACKLALGCIDNNAEKRNLAQGNVGAGCGCSVGKMGLPERAMKSGFGWSGLKLGDVSVIACVAVNALGNVLAKDGSWLAGTLDAQGKVCNPLEAATYVRSHKNSADKTCTQNTTLGVVLTNAALSKAECTRISQVTQDAYARVIKPVHTQHDGDAIFTMSACTAPTQTGSVDLVGIMATTAMEQAIRNAVEKAESAYGFTAACDL